MGAQYVWDLPKEWRATLRGDFYWQGDSWGRIYNAVNDRLHGYDVVNATLTLDNHPLGVDIQLYVKNLFDAQPIVATFLTDPTSGLYTNVFTLDPRTFGAQITKKF
jgi:outer membrane receptor protein involved in Fe transport